MSNLIVDHTDIDEPGEEIEGTFETTRVPVSADGKSGMEFHVQMRGYQLSGFEEAIIQTAARLIVGRHNETVLAKAIEDAAAKQISQQIDSALRPITKEILDQPMIPKQFSKSEPVTLREFIGLCGREYLTQHVDRDGKPTKADYYNNSEPRMAQIIRQTIDAQFKKDIQAASSALINEVRCEMKARLDLFLASEKARLREAVEQTLK